MGNERSRRTEGERILRQRIIARKNQTNGNVIASELSTMLEIEDSDNAQKIRKAKTSALLDGKKELLEVLVEEQRKGTHNGLGSHLIETAFFQSSPDAPHDILEDDYSENSRP